MGRSKIIINQETYIDLTSDTVNANNTLVGASGHGADGEPFNGAVAFVTYYTGSSAPSASLGNDGDIYLQTA